MLRDAQFQSSWTAPRRIALPAGEATLHLHVFVPMVSHGHSALPFRSPGRGGRVREGQLCVVSHARPTLGCGFFASRLAGPFHRERILRLAGCGHSPDLQGLNALDRFRGRVSTRAGRGLITAFPLPFFHSFLRGPRRWSTTLAELLSNVDAVSSASLRAAVLPGSRKPPSLRSVPANPREKQAHEIEGI